MHLPQDYGWSCGSPQSREEEVGSEREDITQVLSFHLTMSKAPANRLTISAIILEPSLLSSMYSLWIKVCGDLRVKEYWQFITWTVGFATGNLFTLCLRSKNMIIDTATTRPSRNSTLRTAPTIVPGLIVETILVAGCRDNLCDLWNNVLRFLFLSFGVS